MRYLKNILIVLIGVALASCNTDFLNKDPLNEFTNQQEWNDPNLAETYLNGLYDEIPWGLAATAGLVDESRSRGDAGLFNLNNMLITPDDPRAGDWNGDYSRIRHCNVFLNNMVDVEYDTTKVDGVTLKERMVGEAHFIRAYIYFDLVKYYGGVALITKVYNLKDSFKVARNTFAESIDFIVKDLDTAAEMLPLVQSGDNDGRATKGAALALKSRVLLYAASDLHNPGKNAAVVGGFEHPELLGYTEGDPQKRWQAAKTAAKAVMDLGVYELYEPEPSSAEEATQNYSDLFTSNQNVENIFVRYRNASLSQGYDGWSIAPNGWYGNAGIGALNELVDAYEMADGTPFSRDIKPEADQPYKNRDPRFYATVLFEGNAYRERPADLKKYDPEGVGQFGTWEKWDPQKKKKYLVYGLDSRNSIANSWNGNRCGATMLKWLDKSVDIETADQDLTWKYIRYGEVLLNYAEACIELGEDAEARKYINQIRKRAFMPPVTESGTALKMRYRNERRVEMAYEDQRFFDVRRWMIGPKAYHAVHGVNIVYKLKADHTTAAIPTITPIEIMTGKWENKAYFFPINRTEMQRNDQLIQNPGYE